MKFWYILKKSVPYFEVEILLFNIRLKDKTLFEYFNYLMPLTDSKFWTAFDFEKYLQYKVICLNLFFY